MSILNREEGAAKTPTFSPSWRRIRRSFSAWFYAKLSSSGVLAGATTPLNAGFSCT